MRRRLAKVVAIAAAIPFAVAAVLSIVGPHRLWEQFGPADLGAVDFATLVRRQTPNDALACLPRLCAAKADVAAPVFGGAQGDILRAIERALASEPDLEQVGSRPEQGILRFVQRSRLMRFPDTIDVQVIPASGGFAVLIYSRSQMGQRDMGVNRARVERWMGLIEKDLKG